MIVSTILMDVLNMLINAFASLLEVLHPLFTYFSISEISFGMFVIFLSYRFLLSPWLSRYDMSGFGESNTTSPFCLEDKHTK